MKKLKNVLWFIKESTKFLNKGVLYVLFHGGITKSIKHANFMSKWNRLTAEERLNWYLTSNRVIEF